MVRNHRGRGQVSIAYLALLAAAVLIVVVLVVRQVWRSNTTEVWVARDGVRAGEVLDSSKLVLANLSKTAVPPNAILDPTAVLGKTLQKSVDKGKPITVADVTEQPQFTFLSDAPPEGKVVMTVRASGLAVPANQLRYGDRLELISSTGAGSTRVIGHDLLLLGVSSPVGTTQARSSSGSLAGLVNASLNRRPAPVSSFVVAVDPQDVVPISEALAGGSSLTYVIHGRQELTSGRRVEIASHDASGQVELITGARRETIK